VSDINNSLTDEALKNEVLEGNKTGWWSRLKGGLKRSTDRLNEGLKTVFTDRKLNQQMLDQLEELLISSDLGVETASLLVNTLAKNRLDQNITLDEVKNFLANSIGDILSPVAQALTIQPNYKPHVIVVVGVNGSGKTTTIGKFAKQWHDNGLSVIMAAGDTFRAAAVEQLQIWGQRLGIPVIHGPQGGDPASLAFDALCQARKDKADVLLVDTAGRLQNKADLMEELQKILRVLKKVDSTAPHTILLVLDGTTGQNAHNQVKIFQEIINITGLVITKLDGTAKGGVVVSLARKFGLPVHALGTGESEEDLQPFTSTDFARNLLGLDSGISNRKHH
jgi:fused signal recognition particle receptor